MPDDNIPYLNLIEDIIYYDSLKQAMSMQLKRVLAPWCPYIAFMSVVSGAHIVFISNVVFPAILLLVFYIVLYIFGEVCLGRKTEHGAWKYLAFAALFTTVIPDTSPYYSLIIHTVMWGNIVTGTILLPLLFIAFHSAVSDEGKIAPWIWILFCIGASCATATTISMVIVSVEMLVLMVVYAIRNNIKRVMICTIAGEIPLLFQGVLYLLIQNGIIAI